MKIPETRPCRICKQPTITKWRWDRFDHSQRDYLRSKGITSRVGRDLCAKHHARFRRYGDPEHTPLQKPRPARGSQTRTREEVLEEWVMLRSDGVTDLRVAAERMGMTHSALDMALYRARKRGDIRGAVRRNDELGGAQQGTTGFIIDDRRRFA